MSHHVTISLTNIDQDVKVSASEMELEEAFFNIMNNGITAMERGGALTITSEIDESKQRVMVNITDKGKGFSKDNISKALAGVLKSEEDGRLAMGLFLAKYRVEQHGGDITIQSKVGKGTTVTVALPCVSS
ncbi:MAG: PAS/PAC sensor signal transduction histidine kinase [uncultured bacterium]|nr:MAG: PAS/PAC sensor signal transduction histidine kinase [uncultured bacterium]